jgi:hypothetical protein
MHGRRASWLGRAGAISLIAAVVPLASQAFASTTDWSLSTGGLYTSSGSEGVLTGSNIPVLSVLGDGTLVHNGSSLSILDGVLNFTSGAYNGSDRTGAGALAAFLTSLVASPELLPHFVLGSTTPL